MQRNICFYTQFASNKCIIMEFDKRGFVIVTLLSRINQPLIGKGRDIQVYKILNMVLKLSNTQLNTTSTSIAVGFDTNMTLQLASN